jgi:hypothetical protein
VPTKKPAAGLLATLGAPALRALQHAGLTTPNALAKRTEREVLALHGMGPASLPKLRAVLEEAGLAFKNDGAPAKAPSQSRSKAARAPMRMKNIPADTPAEYAKAVAAFGDWRSRVVASLRRAVRAAADVEEVLKWGHLVYFSNGPAFLIRVEDTRVLFGFWRGKHLRDIEPRLKPGGKYEMATLDLRAGDKPPSSATVRALVQEAVRLNDRRGSPQAIAKRARA